MGSVSRSAIYQWDASAHVAEMKAIARKRRIGTGEVFNAVADSSPRPYDRFVRADLPSASPSPELMKFVSDLDTYKAVVTDLFIEAGLGPDVLQLVTEWNNGESYKLVHPRVYLIVNLHTAGMWALKQLRELHRSKMGGR